MNILKSIRVRIVVMLFSTATILTGFCATIQEINEHLASLAAEETGGKLEVSHVSAGEFEETITTSGSTLVLERTFKQATSKPPYTKKIQVYSTNGYISYKDGGTVNNGKRVTSEATLRSKEQPVVGLPVFASKHFQARLLYLLKEPTIEAGQFEGKAAYVIKARTFLEGTFPVNIRLFFEKTDYLLLAQELSSDNNPLESERLVAMRTEDLQSIWPYSVFHFETWSNNTLVSRMVWPVSAKRIPSESSIRDDNFSIPTNTLVTDERFGYPVLYRTGENPRLSNNDIAKMATDPDYRTNSYFLNFYKIESRSNPPTDSRKRHIIILAIILASLVPLIAFSLHRIRAVKRS